MEHPPFPQLATDPIDPSGLVCMMIWIFMVYGYALLPMEEVVDVGGF